MSAFRAILFIVLALCLVVPDQTLLAQESEETYVRETDPLVVAKLDEWQDLKFGFMMHWGLYSYWGIIESWSLCPEDWITRHGHGSENYFSYKSAYEHIITQFNPERFNPERWAAAAKEAGMKYVVVTTKHHDGFCMFDTKTTDYKITSPQSPFGSNPRANVAKEIFGAFRGQGFWIGAYFSKPDWHCPYYWDPYWPPFDRNVNYDTKKYPEKWRKFQDYTYTQIEELMTDYGKMDILWLDGAWVAPLSQYSPFFNTIEMRKVDQDVNMGKIAVMARSHQPGLLVVDRWVASRYENYLTPEQKAIDSPLSVPWESCVTMARNWGYVPNDVYKPARRLIHLLVDIVSKGGNLLLDVGPNPSGELEPVAYERMREIGQWMKVNGDAIYGTRPVAPYKDDRIRFTRKKDGAVYAIYLADEKESTLPETIRFAGITPAKNATVTVLGAPGELVWKEEDGGISIAIPKDLCAHPPCKDAWSIRISAVAP
jgi:alpha-L-fucosidase